jgi:AraC-like DNA-binding protein
MACAGRELARSRSLTEAAYAAGFASSAHFSTAFRLMFGLSPSALMKGGVRFDIDGVHGPGA